jgi:hypothetical protein
MWLLGWLLFAAECAGLVLCLLSVFAHSYIRVVSGLISGHCWFENGNSGMGPARMTHVQFAMSPGNEAAEASGHRGTERDIIKSLFLQRACMNIEVYQYSAPARSGANQTELG